MAITLSAGYSGTPLVKKLGIKPHNTVAIIDPPDGYHETLGKLPGDVVLLDKLKGQLDIAQIFVRSKTALDKKFLAAKV